jgi:hypothetical protein
LQDGFNDWRRDRTQQSAANQRFARIEAAMPALLNAQGESIYRMTEEFVKLLDSRAADLPALEDQLTNETR